MTQQAPERILASVNTPDAQSKSGTWHERPYGTEYLRADLSPSPEDFQQMREALALSGACLEAIRAAGAIGSDDLKQGVEEAICRARAALKAAEGNAQAALDRMLRRAKNEALEKAATAAYEFRDGRGLQGTGCIPDQIAAAIRVMKEPEE